MSVIRECIINEIRMKLVEFDHNGLPADPCDDHRKTLLELAAITVYALEEIDKQKLGDAV